jgi:hypothetical protein
VPSVMKLLRELMQWSFEFVVVTDEDRSNACFFPQRASAMNSNIGALIMPGHLGGRLG